MKLGGPLRRNKRLARGAPLAGGGPLRRSGVASSSGRRDTGPRVSVSRMVRCRAAGGDCESPPWCEWPGCARRGSQSHHRLNRKVGGRHGAGRERVNGAAWLLRCCAEHHRAVTSQHGEALAVAKAMGWVLDEWRDGAPTVAEQVPVLTRHWPTPVLLCADGDWIVPFETGD